MLEERQDATAVGEGELFRLLAENVLDYAIFCLDSQGYIQTWPLGAERLLGYPKEEMLGRSVEMLFTPEDVQSGVPKQEMEQARLKGRGEDDRWHVRKDGSRFWASGVMTPLWDENGKLRGFAKIMRDRMEMRLYEQSQIESEASKAAVLETAIDGIITIDHEDRIVEFNAAAERLFGYSRAAALGQKMGELIVPPHFRERHYNGMAHYLATGQGPVLGKRLRLTAMRADGTEFPVELAIIRVPGTGSPLFTGFVRDITERETQERRRIAQLTVTEILAEAATVNDAAPRILQVICENLDWNIGEFWLLDKQTQLLRCLSIWCDGNIEADDFVRASRERTFASGVGLPGRVWSTGKPHCLSDVTVDRNFPRLALAAQAGLHGAMAVPLRLGTEVLGVIEFLSKSIREVDADLLGMMTTIGGNIGQFIQRKYAEEGLRVSEERLRTLTDNLPQGAVFRAVQNLETRLIHFTFLSAGIEQIYGISAEEGVADGNLIYSAIHEDDRNRVLTEETGAIQNGEQLDSEFRIRHRSGEVRWLHCRAAPDPLPNNQVVWEGVMLDITDRKRAEVSLRENEDRLRFALEAGQLGTWNWDIRNNHVTWSQQLEAIHGLQPGTFPGTFEAYQLDIHPDDRKQVLTSIEKSLSSDEDHHVEYRLVLPDGSVRWVEARGKVFRDEAGQPMHMIGVCTEITERKRREDDLRFMAEASRSLAAVMDYESTLQHIAGLAVPHFADWCSIHLPVDSGLLRTLAMSHVDPEKVQLAIELNQRWPPDLEAPRGIYHVYRTGVPELQEDISESLLRESAKDEEHFQMLRTLGLKSYICVPLISRKNTIGVITFITAESGRQYSPADLAFAEDLARRAAIASENARLYASLRDEGRKKDEFLAMLAHELRNPLAPIRSGLDLLKMMGTDSEIIDTMQQQFEHLVRLVDDLLDVSRIMRGKVELRREPVELSSVLARAIDTVKPLAELHGQNLSVDLPKEPIWIEADAVRLAQVIGNLLNNSSKYTEPGGHIHLSAESISDQVIIRVHDTGIGIRPELLPQVFDLFTQDQQTIDRSQGGLGIGLTVVKSLVEMHGGTVSVKSEGPGKGSEFAVRLPTASHTPSPSASDQESVEATDLRILVVDDNVSAATILSLLLRKLGNHQTFMAHDGLAALAAAKEYRPDLILLDIGLPRLNGFDVARQLRQQPEFRQVYVVALTGYGTEEDRRKSLEAGFDEHLVKPPDAKTLRKLLNSLTKPKITNG